MREAEKKKVDAKWRTILEHVRKKGFVPALIVNAGLMLFLLVATVVLFLRLKFLEDRIAYSVEPALAEAKELVQNAQDTMLRFELTTKSLGSGSSGTRRPAAPRSSHSGLTSKRARRSAIPTRQPAPSNTEAPPPPVVERDSPITQPVHRRARPDDAVKNFLGLMTDLPLNASEKADIRKVYVQVVSQGEAVVEPLLNYLSTIGFSSESTSFVCKALEELATQQHKDQLLELFQTHDALAGALAALRLPEAEPLILDKLREERASYSPELLKAATTLNIAEAYPLIAGYAAASGDLDAVSILCSASENKNITQDDLLHVLESRDNWPDSPSARMSARKIARTLLRRGKREGLDFLASELETGGDTALDPASMRSLRRSVEYSGAMSDFPVWLSINVSSLEWSNRKKRFVVP